MGVILYAELLAKWTRHFIQIVPQGMFMPANAGIA
jgi:hypothetical protein